MKRTFLNFCAAATVVCFAACNNSGTTADGKDTTAATPPTTTETTPTSTTSTGTYAALADSVEKNSQQGYYLNPKTGKTYSALKVDRTSGKVMTEAGEPVEQYVDNRNWWVYGGENWEHVSDAKMEGDKLLYKDEGDKWVDYDKTKWKISDNGQKQKMVTEDGDKVKIKTDEEGNTKIKVNGEKVKLDKDGNVKKD